MNKINQKLKDMYLSEQKDIQQFSDKCATTWIKDEKSKEESWFIYQLAYATEKYCESKMKIMVIGQETNGWGTDAYTDIDKSMNGTNEFQTGNSYNSPFWQFVREISQKFNGEEFRRMDSVVWANILKLSNDQEPKYLKNSHPELLQEYCTKFQTLAKEIQIVNPDIVLLLTGHYYDGYLGNIFNKVEFQTVDSEYTVKELSRLVHNQLPKNTFRLYHPNYARHNGDRLWTSIIDKLVTVCSL